MPDRDRSGRRGEALRRAARQARDEPAARRRSPNKSDAFLAIKSLEGDPSEPRPDTSKAAEGLAAAGAEAAKTSPHFGALLTYANAVGVFWPAGATYKPTAIKAAGSPTILLVNDTRDNATPLSDAQAVSKQLANNVLVTNDADGHGAYGRGACITKVVDDFLGDGTIPAKGTACKET